MNKKVKDSVKIILKEIRKNCIPKEHKFSELNPDCPACKFRLLESYLIWYLDLFIWDEKFNKKK